ncbi:MAG: hypothetical protein GC164_14570 [Phycisphaera sp.]|nr:hypothetical protein [Phycisphaera sp.]
MSSYNAPKLSAVPFDKMPPAFHARAFGVEYIRLEEPDGGELYVTRYGWPVLEHLMADQWYLHNAYAVRGTKLPGATGSVYRVPTINRRGRRRDLVVKFSRFAQDVPIYVATNALDMVPPEALANAEFNGPFEEFGQLMRLRRPHPTLPAVRTKRPLAIYSPPREYPLWQLGRTKGRFIHYQKDQIDSQQQDPGTSAINLNIQRQYVLLYQWVRGENAEYYFDQGLLTKDELHSLTQRVVDALSARGLVVLDNKPRHFILRPRHGGDEPMRRNGELVYNLVDFELLKPKATL